MNRMRELSSTFSCCYAFAYEIRWDCGGPEPRRVRKKRERDSQKHKETEAKESIPIIV